MFVCWSEFVSPIRSFAVSCSSRGLFVDQCCLFVFLQKICSCEGFVVVFRR